MILTVLTLKNNIQLPWNKNYDIIHCSYMIRTHFLCTTYTKTNIMCVSNTQRKITIPWACSFIIFFDRRKTVHLYNPFAESTISMHHVIYVNKYSSDHVRKIKKDIFQVFVYAWRSNVNKNSMEINE